MAVAWGPKILYRFLILTLTSLVVSISLVILMFFSEPCKIRSKMAMILARRYDQRRRIGKETTRAIIGHDRHPGWPSPLRSAGHPAWRSNQRCTNIEPTHSVGAARERTRARQRRVQRMKWKFTAADLLRVCVETGIPRLKAA